MNLSNASRSMLSNIPGLNKAIDFICARANEVFSAQHDPETGAHTTITTTGDVSVGGNLTVAGDDTIEFRGDVIARFASGEESGIGALQTVNGTALLAGEPLRNGLLIGGVANGLFLEWRAAGSPFTGGGFELRVWNLPFSTTTGVLRFGNVAGVPMLIDGGTGSTKIGIGGGGRPLLSLEADDIYGGNGLHEHGRTPASGDWTAVTYAAGNFTASAGTWTVDAGDQLVYEYMLVGKTMWVNFSIVNTDVSNAAVSLRIAIPGGFICATEVQPFIRVFDAGGAAAVGLAIVASAGTVIQCFATVAGGGFGITAADNTNVIGLVCFKVQ